MTEHLELYVAGYGPLAVGSVIIAQLRDMGIRVTIIGRDSDRFARLQQDLYYLARRDGGTEDKIWIDAALNSDDPAQLRAVADRLTAGDPIIFATALGDGQEAFCGRLDSALAEFPPTVPILWIPFENKPWDGLPEFLAQHPNAFLARAMADRICRDVFIDSDQIVVRTEDYREMLVEMPDGATDGLTAVWRPVLAAMDAPVVDDLTGPLMRKKIFGCVHTSNAINAMTENYEMTGEYAREWPDAANELKGLALEAGAVLEVQLLEIGEPAGSAREWTELYRRRIAADDESSSDPPPTRGRTPRRICSRSGPQDRHDNPRVRGSHEGWAKQVPQGRRLKSYRSSVEGRSSCVDS